MWHYLSKRTVRKELLYTNSVQKLYIRVNRRPNILICIICTSLWPVPQSLVRCQKQPSPVQIELACDSAPSASSPGPTEGSDSWSELCLLHPATKGKDKSISAEGCMLISPLHSSLLIPSVSVYLPPCCVCTDSAGFHSRLRALTASEEH